MAEGDQGNEVMRNMKECAVISDMAQDRKV